MRQPAQRLQTSAPFPRTAFMGWKVSRTCIQKNPTPPGKTGRVGFFEKRHSVRIVAPGLLSLPAMFLPVPPLMVLVPAMLALGVEIAPSAVSLGAVVAMIMDGFIEVCLRLLDRVLAL